MPPGKPLVAAVGAVLDYSVRACHCSGKDSARNAGDTVQSLGWEDSLEKGMATHSGILA